VNRQPVSSVAEYKAAISKLKPGQNVVFKVLRRQDNNRILTVYLPGVVPADTAQ
jgi:S1-C subfamily serine protease